MLINYFTPVPGDELPESLLFKKNSFCVLFPLYLIISDLFWSPFQRGHSVISALSFSLLFFCFLAPLQWFIEYSVVFSSLRYTAVWGQSSGWCEISHFLESGHTSLKSQQTYVANLLPVTSAMTSGTFALKYWKTISKLSNVANLQFTNKTVCDLKQCLKLSVCVVFI